MIVALDLETTGVDKEKDKIIEVALIKFDEVTFEIIDTFSTLIHPGCAIPELISNITNIFDEDVKNAPPFDEEIRKKITEFIGDLPLLGHNTNFDRDFLLKNGIPLEDNIVLDTFHLSNMVYFQEKSLNLGSLCESLGIVLEGAHRAIHDTKATLDLFAVLVKKIQNFSYEKRQVLQYIFQKNSQKEFLFYQKLFGFDERTTTEEFISLLLAQISPYKEITLESFSDTFQDTQDLGDVFNGFENFEVRQNQLQMSKMVQSAFDENKKLVIEAPTGVGKTFAYLIPAVLTALKKKTQVLVSTHTKALQDQIYFKDLSFLHSQWKGKFSYAKLKGRKNYFSISQYFFYFYQNEELEPSEVIFLSKLALWLFETEFGELDELNYYFKEYTYLKYIHADNFLVLTDQNEYKNYEFLYKARSDAQNAHIVIINHSLLIQDRQSSNPLFGDVSYLVVDESHNLEDSATDACRKSFQILQLEETFEKIQKQTGKHSYIVDNYEIKTSQIINQLTLLFDIFTDYAFKKNTYGNEVFDVYLDIDFFQINPEVVNLLHTTELLFVDFMNQLSVTPDNIYSSIKSDLSFLEEILSIIKIALQETSRQTFIPIFSYNKHTQSTLSYTLLHPGKYLQGALWEKLQGIVLTSATLQINESFDYMSKILSLPDFEFHILKTDFDYSKQALLYVPEDLGSVKFNNPKINYFLLKFLEIVRGNTLVLLTSFTSIKDIFLSINIPLKKLGTTVLAQNVGGSKHKIANHFRHHADQSVILGTDSFWEGIDIPGDDLKYLVIHKFPFLVPTDPIFVARGRLFHDAFREYSIPKSIIKTKQGFGRLIRTKSDTGIVILLDDRYSQSQWGNLMRSAFPSDIKIKQGYSTFFLDLMSKKMQTKKDL